jgi:diguanylate cyclase (GGDEF)-like protein
MIIGAGMEHMVTGFIVTGDGAYLGIANGHDLLNEITQRKQSDLYFLAHYDHLTGIPNRMLFGDRLMQACREALRNGTLVGLLFVDVDRFKQVNDSMGHSFGDLLLCAVTKRLQACAREADTVARLGGDEFAILMDNLKDTEDPKIVAQRIVNSMLTPLHISGRTLSVSVSIGIAIYPNDDDDVAVLLTKADTAMYEAKARGRNGYRVYNPGLSIYDDSQLSLNRA